MDKFEAYLRAAEVAAGQVYTKVAGTYQAVNEITHEHPEIKAAAALAETLLAAVGINVAPEVNMAKLVWGKLGMLLALDPTVSGPVPLPVRV